MAGYAICPYCKATVQPQLAADGRKVCPLCQNTGRPMAPPRPVAPAPAFQPPTPVPMRPNAPGALGSLICGIIGIVTSSFAIPGIVLGIIAIVLGGKARKAIAAEPGKHDGQGLATAGRVCGIVALVLGILTLVLFVVVLVLVFTLADTVEAAEFDAFDSAGPGGVVTVSSVNDDTLLWSDLVVETDADCSVPTGPVERGDSIVCQQDGTVVIRHGMDVLLSTEFGEPA